MNAKEGGAFLTRGQAEKVIFTTEKSPKEKIDMLQKTCRVYVCGKDKVDLNHALSILYELGIRTLMVEGGGELIASFFKEDLVDEINLKIGNMILGGRTAPTLCDGDGFTQETAKKVKIVSVTPKENYIILNCKVEHPELIDILDALGQSTGQVCTREEVHKRGLWHKEVAVWIANDNNELLFQKRSQNKVTNPGKWALCAGHVCVVESSVMTAIKEAYEELGLMMHEKDLTFFTTTRVSEKGIDGIENNFFGDMFFYRTNKDISEFVIQKEEVDKIKYIGYGELKAQIQNNNEDYVFKNNSISKTVFAELDKILVSD